MTTRTTVESMGDFSSSRVVATCFPLPSLADGDTIYYCGKDIIKQVTFPADAYILQAGCIKDGIIYMAYGYGESGDTSGKIRIYNTDTDTIDVRINLAGAISAEPEDLEIYNDKFYLNTARAIYSIELKEVRQASRTKSATILMDNIVLETE